MQSPFPVARLTAAILSTLLVACCGANGDSDCAPDDPQAALVQGLADADPEVRVGAVIGLALQRDQATADALARAAVDPDPGVRSQAREALRILADDGIVPAGPDADR